MHGEPGRARLPEYGSKQGTPLPFLIIILKAEQLHAREADSGEMNVDDDDRPQEATGFCMQPTQQTSSALVSAVWRRVWRNQQPPLLLLHHTPP